MILQPVLDLLNAFPRNLILPPTSLFLVIAVGLALWRRWPRAGRIVAGSGLAALAFLCTGAGAQLFVRPLEAMTAPLRAPERAGAQAIVVLAAGHVRRAPEYEGRDIPDYIALMRLRYAAHLQRRTGLPLLVSGGNGADDGRPAPGRPRAYAKADGMAAALREDFGVPVRWIEWRSRDTAENAAFSAEMLKAGGIKRILLVTDAMHMPRAHAVFAQAGIEVVDAPTMFYTRRPLSLDAWVPDAEGMRLSWYAIYESIGLAWYRIRVQRTS